MGEIWGPDHDDPYTRYRVTFRVYTDDSLELDVHVFTQGDEYKAVALATQLFDRLLPESDTTSLASVEVSAVDEGLTTNDIHGDDIVQRWEVG